MFKIRLKQIVPNKRSGQVQVGSYVVQYVIAEQEVLSNLIAVSADLSQHPQSIHPCKCRDEKEAAKTR